jgi:hypothetical protein
MCLDGTVLDPAPLGASTKGELAPPWTPQLMAVISKPESE